MAVIVAELFTTVRKIHIYRSMDAFTFNPFFKLWLFPNQGSQKWHLNAAFVQHKNIIKVLFYTKKLKNNRKWPQYRHIEFERKVFFWKLPSEQL